MIIAAGSQSSLAQINLIRARALYEQVIKKHPGTKAAEEARKLLERK